MKVDQHPFRPDLVPRDFLSLPKLLFVKEEVKYRAVPNLVDNNVDLIS